MASNCPLSVFKRVLLVSAAGDRYVSPHSARIDTPKSAFLDKVAGPSNILLTETLQKKLEVNKTIVERYHVFHQNLPQGKLNPSHHSKTFLFRYGDESNRPRRAHSCSRLSSIHFCISRRFTRLQLWPRQKRFITSNFLICIFLLIKLLYFYLINLIHHFHSILH